MDAWIEILLEKAYKDSVAVASFMDAWIEI